MGETSGVGGRLRRARTRRGWTQEEVATRLGLTSVTVSNHERGTTAPSDELLAAYAEAYGTSVPLLRYGTEGATAGEAGADRFYEGVLWMAERMSAEITAGLRDARLLLRGELPPPPPRDNSARAVADRTGAQYLERPEGEMSAEEWKQKRAAEEAARQKRGA